MQAIQREREPPRNTVKDDGVACGFIICYAEVKLYFSEVKLAEIEDFR